MHAHSAACALTHVSRTIPHALTRTFRKYYEYANPKYRPSWHSHSNPEGVRGLGRPLGQALPHHLDPPPQPGHTPLAHAGVRGPGRGVGGLAHFS
eukprot:scaffold14478_cov73-Phaeocystis_antarctica.AAC.4